MPPTSSRVTTAQEQVEFSSPLVVKVRKEVARERREEVDLETGKRRSWVESTEFDVLDLTGWISCILVKMTGQHLCFSSSLIWFPIKASLQSQSRKRFHFSVPGKRSRNPK